MDVQLSATSIRDYQDCARRFQLRYLLEQPWPAPENEPLLEYERSRQRGSQFHRLMERFYLGVDARTLSDMVADPIVRGWWQVHQDQKPIDVAANKRLVPEKMFRAKLDDYNLTAFFDLVAIGQDDTVTIIDWKTTRRIPDPVEWSNSIQTLVYLYVLGENLTALHSESTSMSNIRMLYWFVEYPDKPIWITYSDRQHEQAKDKLRILLQPLFQRLKSDPKGEWSKTSDLKKCSYCVYRSLCDRGIRADSLLDFTEPDSWQISDLDTDEQD